MQTCGAPIVVEMIGEVCDIIRTTCLLTMHNAGLSNGKQSKKKEEASGAMRLSTRKATDVPCVTRCKWPGVRGAHILAIALAMYRGSDTNEGATSGCGGAVATVAWLEGE